MIPFETPVQQKCYEQVLQWIRELYPDLEMRLPQSKAVIGLVRGSAYIEVGIWPWGEAEATITTHSCVVSEPQLTTECLQFLLQENARMKFGAFAVDDRGDILLQHTIVGSTCGKEEIDASVRAITTQADHYDDIIIRRWGGVRAITQGR